MSIEKLIEDLTDALRENTAALKARGVAAVEVPGVGAAAARSAKPPKAAPPKADDVPAITLEAMKAKVTEVTKVLGVEVGRRLLDETRAGAKKLPDLKPEDYATFVAKADMALAEASQ